MPRKIPMSELNARNIDIINTIRQRASAQYQSLIPEISDAQQVPAVGETLYGYPNLANEFLQALLNRIALVVVKSANFNNKFAKFKKGYLEYGETVEEVFVELAKAREFSVEKAEAREFKRTLPDVRSAFHSINYRVQYPISIQTEELRQAFLSADGLENLVAKIVDSIYQANEYDEYLLFKYLIIKAVAHGKMYPVPVDMSDFKNASVAFRGYSNQLEFIDTKYNIAGVHTTTQKRDQYIFMDSMFNASYDVNVLASAFNMDKADFMGKLTLVDGFDTFDNERFDIIRAESSQLELVTDAELNLMKNVKAVLLDDEWFQFYDNLSVMTEAQVASGLYWNYFYTTWKTVSSSPFSNAIVFVDDSASTTIPNTVTYTIASKVKGNGNTILTLKSDDSVASMALSSPVFVQTQANTTAGVAVHEYGAYIFPDDAEGQTLELNIGDKVFRSSATVDATADVGDTVTFNAI